MDPYENSDYAETGFLSFIAITYVLLIIVYVIREVILDEDDVTLDLKKRHKIVKIYKYYKKLLENQEEVE